MASDVGRDGPKSIWLGGGKVNYDQLSNFLTNSHTDIESSSRGH